MKIFGSHKAHNSVSGSESMNQEPEILVRVVLEYSGFDASANYFIFSDFTFMNQIY